MRTYILAGLLENQTSLEPRELISDSAGYSDIVFGLFWLLGYQFSPRLADIGTMRLWRIESDRDYGALNNIARNKISMKLIEQDWDEALRIAGSLKMGTISPNELMRMFQKPKSSLARTIAELGRITKTIYLLRYVDDENYRRRILTQINRSEGRHSLARAIFHGKRGQLRKRYRQGQEDQLGTLGLVLNAIVLWNTRYIQLALDELEKQGFKLQKQDIARLSPLVHEHINFLGRYHFELEQKIKQGHFRPLHQAQMMDELLW